MGAHSQGKICAYLLGTHTHGHPHTSTLQLSATSKQPPGWLLHDRRASLAFCASQNSHTPHHALQAAIDDKIKGSLIALRGRALGAQLVNVGVPPSWREATSDKQKAQQDIDFALNERQQQLAQANNTITLALQDARIINQTAATNVSITLANAQQSAAAVAAEYEAFGAVLLDMVEQYKLDPAGLIRMLQNNLVANSKSVDLVLPAAV
jgi:hypothetical protein